MGNSRGKRVIIAITTYRRPELLGPLLEVVREHVRRAPIDFDISMIVVDNDPAESAREVASRYCPDAVRYVAETQPGIAAARQRALDETPDGSLLVYLDDDVVPTDTWLIPLITLWKERSAVIVVGYVRYIFPDGVDAWVAAGGFMRRTSRPTGTRLTAAAAGNMLVDVDAVRRIGVAFDRTLGLSGGEDTLFTTQVSRQGGKILWCQESVVDDHIPLHRATREFCKARARSHGSTAVAVALRLAATPGRRRAARAYFLLGGLLRAAWGYGRRLLGRATGSVWHDADGTRVALRGFGMAYAAAGFSTTEYRRSSQRSGSPSSG